jgi:hypothetical protein
VLRHFGRAFARESLPDATSVDLLLGPLSLLELFSQLATPGAQEAFDAIQAFPRIHNPQATGLLPWSDEFFRISLFRLAPREDTLTSDLNSAVIKVLNAKSPEELRSDGEKMRDNLQGEKAASAAHFRALVETAREEGDLDAQQHKTIFAHSIARRSGVPEQGIAVDHIVNSLDAHLRFEMNRIETAIRNNKYNIERRRNDLLDAEFLIYLAEPSFHFLTCDKGFSRAGGSPQANRIHIASTADLETAEGAISTLRGIAQGL